MKEKITIRENEKSWTVKKSYEKLSVTYNISKELCADKTELDKYLKKERIIG